MRFLVIRVFDKVPQKKEKRLMSQMDSGGPPFGLSKRPDWEERVREAGVAAIKGPSRPKKGQSLIYVEPGGDEGVPWADNKRNKIRYQSLGLSEACLGQIRWLADRLPQSQNQLIRNIVEPAVDEIAQKIYRREND